ncbi:MAG: D-alanyl-D-alanine carboxypeptidase family protein [Nostoc sp. ChiSLP02]|nr:D-alanyl-D-alanine carboxypeptidase family protein [Nostoc sp. DedSLP05]MDZ8099080.1 D-alanyl-D-alanine carboxypeptidase family protein [Nostoc sp. DedSLP01]MDZ8187514.1 D-alanyl-D-alanine carboxypeptidase family protein [Nostoc sp. ChiSLP02]
MKPITYKKYFQHKFVKIGTFSSTVILMIFALAASNKISHHKLAVTAQPLKECLSTDPLPCKGVSKELTSQPFIPDQKLNEQQRFLSAIARNLSTIPQPNTYEYTLLRTYGSVFVNPGVEIKLPPKELFANEQETQEYQATLTMGHVEGTRDCYLQKSAADALNKARKIENIPLKSGYGSGDCTRTFNTNLQFWHKYANNQTLAQVQQGKETKILGLVAPPGTSQHLWGLAIDLRVSNQKQRQVLNQNGWFQTVENDVPHWTYIGLSEDKLPLFGLKNKLVRGINYWVTPL